MLTNLPNLNIYNYNNQLFNLNLSQNKSSIDLVFKLRVPLFNTSKIPSTYYILERHLPGIFEHKCFNNQKLPFSKEVLNTEVGHLFEHILIEYLYQLKLSQGEQSAMFKGETRWDWNIEEKGVFNITINSKLSDLETLKEALEKSINLISLILNSTHQRNNFKSYQVSTHTIAE